MAKHDREYQAYQREVQSYLQKVKGGRRVPAADPQASQFSQRADDERQAKRAGLGAFIQHGPPTPVMQPPLLSQQQMPQQQPAAPPPGGLMDWLKQRLPGRAAAPSPVWGFHEPTHTMAEGIGPLTGAAANTLSDPRNAWFGLGPLAAISRPAGWGAEALRRYKLIGGTPETLNHTLTNRAMDPSLRGETVKSFRQATDIAAPPTSELTGSNPQLFKMDDAGDLYQDFGRRPTFEYPPRSPIESAPPPKIESNTRGNAAYGALSRQVGRMLDSPGFGLGKPSKYGPEPTPDMPAPQYEWGHGPGGLYEAQDRRTRALNERLSGRPPRNPDEQ